MTRTESHVLVSPQSLEGFMAKKAKKAKTAKKKKKSRKKK